MDYSADLSQKLLSKPFGDNQSQKSYSSQKQENQTSNINSTKNAQPYTVSVEAALFLCGNAHKYQFKVIMLMSLTCLVAAFLNMGFPYLFDTPEVACYNSSQTNEQAIYCTVENACSQNTNYYYPDQNSSKSLTEQFDLICSEDSYEGISGALLLLGGCIGSLYYADSTEKAGRQRVIKECMWIMAISSLIATFSINIYMFSLCLLFFGIGFRAFFNACIIYLTETTSNTIRQLAPNILSIGWALGQIIIAFLAMINTSWYYFTFIYTAIPLLVLITFSRTIVESPRYLIMKKKFQEAKAAVISISKINFRPLPENLMLQEEVKQQAFKDNFDKIFGGNKIMQQEQQNQGLIKTKVHSFKCLFEYNSLRIRTIILTYLWCLLSFAYFVSAFSIEHFAGNVHFNLIGMGIGELVAYLYSGYISLRYPRKDIIRGILFTAGVIHLAFFIFLTLDTANSLVKIITFVSIIALRLAISTGNCVFNVYIAEVYPTSIRHYAFGYFGFATKFIAIFAPPFVQLCESLGTNPFIPLSIFFFVGIPMLSKLRETFEQALKEQVEEEESVFLQNDIPLISMAQKPVNLNR
ncbi:hypothetical protein ABPG72_021543 [Tetrahymena utriculariae]